MSLLENDEEVFPFRLSDKCQSRLLFYVDLLKRAYNKYGRIDKGLDDFNLIVPSTFGSDRRIPVSKDFQVLGERVVIPLLCKYLFGEQGWLEIEPFLRTLKINMIPYGKEYFYYNTDAYHFHVDNKPGRFYPNDIGQIRRVRILFTVVPKTAAQVLSTVYLKDQPKEGFHRQKDFHAWMQERFEFVSCGGRPIYSATPDQVFRIGPGAVAVHKSHPGYPIHAEPNPCPEGRAVFMFDFEDQREMDGFRIVCNRRLPLEKILRLLRCHTSVTA